MAQTSFSQVKYGEFDKKQDIINELTRLGLAIENIKVSGDAANTVTIQKLGNLERKLDALKRSAVITNTPQSNDFRMLKKIRMGICKFFDIPDQVLLSHTKKDNAAYPRHILYYFAVTKTSHSTPNIGKLLNRDHTSIVYGCNKIKEQLKSDPELREKLKKLEKVIHNISLNR